MPNSPKYVAILAAVILMTSVIGTWATHSLKVQNVIYPDTPTTLPAIFKEVRKINVFVCIDNYASIDVSNLIDPKAISDRVLQDVNTRLMSVIKFSAGAAKNAEVFQSCYPNFDQSSKAKGNLNFVVRILVNMSEDKDQKPYVLISKIIYRTDHGGSVRPLIFNSPVIISLSDKDKAKQKLDFLWESGEPSWNIVY